MPFMRLPRALILVLLLTPRVLLVAAETAGDQSLPEIKAVIRFHADGNGDVPEEIALPTSTLLPEKQRRVIVGNLGRLPIRIYLREMPNQPRLTMEVNIVDNRSGQPLKGYPTRQEVGPLGMLSFAIPISRTDLNGLVRDAKQAAKVKIRKIDRVSLHVDIDIPVKADTDADGNLIVDCDDLLRQDDLVVSDLSEKLDDTSTAGTRLAAEAYVNCLNHQTESLSDQLKSEDKAIVERVRSLLPDLAPVGFDSVLNENGGIYFSLLALAGISVAAKQAETANELVKQLLQRPVTNSADRKDAKGAFASCQTTLRHLVPAPVNPDEAVNVADRKKEFRSDLEKAEAALKGLEEVAAKLPDSSAALVGNSAFALLTMAQAYN
jgi:hypothetical protein